MSIPDNYVVPTPGRLPSFAQNSHRFAQEQLARIRETLERSKGAKSIVIDGLTVTYDDLIAQYQFWQRELELLTGQRPLTSRIKLSGL